MLNLQKKNMKRGLIDKSKEANMHLLISSLAQNYLYNLVALLLFITLIYFYHKPKKKRSH